jgi:protein SCO1/2
MSGATPDWVLMLPSVNAGLNALATIFLLSGYAAIRQRRIEVHGWLMGSAFLVSVAFLGCYLTYHWGLHHYTGASGKPFAGTGVIRPIYFAILISHIVLAVPVAVLALVTLYRAWRRQWDRHRRVAKVTFPIWVYVSVTGVVIYLMLYHWPVGP